MTRPQAILAGAAALAVCATSAPAQVPSCGGLGDGALWIGDGRDGSDIAMAEAALTWSGADIAADSAAATLFALGAPRTVRLEARGTGSTDDPVLELYDTAGALIITDDDSGGARASRVETELAAGAYCLLVRGFADSALTADIRVGLLEHAPLTEGLSGGFFDPQGDTAPDFVGVPPCLPDTAASALTQGSLDTALERGGAQATNPVSDTPFYRFTLETPRSLTLRAFNEAADPYIYLFDDTGALIAENDDYDSLNSRIDVTPPLAPGTYCVGMRALANPDLPVTLSVQPLVAGAAQAEAHVSGAATPPIDGSWPVRDLGILPPVSVRDVDVAGTRAAWFAFDIAAPTVLLIDAVGLGDADPVAILFDEAGQRIGFNDDADDGLDSRLVLRLAPGGYLLAIRHYAESYRGAIRLTMERLVRATD